MLGIVSQGLEALLVAQKVGPRHIRGDRLLDKSQDQGNKPGICEGDLGARFNKIYVPGFQMSGTEGEKLIKNFRHRVRRDWRKF